MFTYIPIYIRKYYLLILVCMCMCDVNNLHTIDWSQEDIWSVKMPFVFLSRLWNCVLCHVCCYLLAYILLLKKSDNYNINFDLYILIFFEDLQRIYFLFFNSFFRMLFCKLRNKRFWVYRDFFLSKTFCH